MRDKHFLNNSINNTKKKNFIIIGGYPDLKEALIKRGN